MVWKQAKRYCLNSFNQIFLEPRPPNLHGNCKENEAHLLLFFAEKEQHQLHLPKMIGEKCAIPGSSISRKDKGINTFKAPLANNEFNKKWNQDLSILFWNTENVINF